MEKAVCMPYKKNLICPRQINILETIEKCFIFLWVIIICTEVKWPQGGQLLCSWVLIKVSHTLSMCGFMEPCSWFMMINVFCHSSVLYLGLFSSTSEVIPSSESSQHRPWQGVEERTVPVCCHRVFNAHICWFKERVFLSWIYLKESATNGRWKHSEERPLGVSHWRRKTIPMVSSSKTAQPLWLKSWRRLSEEQGKAGKEVQDDCHAKGPKSIFGFGGGTVGQDTIKKPDLGRQG